MTNQKNRYFAGRRGAESWFSFSNHGRRQRKRIPPTPPVKSPRLRQPDSLPNVLVVADMPADLTRMTALLRGGGFAVWPTSCPGQALDILREHADRIGLALLGLRRPDADVLSLARTLCEARPGLLCCVLGENAGAGD
jgi:hypothetical protein